MKLDIENSSNVKSLEYAEDTRVLTVTFGSGIYDYAEVPDDVFEALVAAHAEGESVGKALNALVRGEFEAQKRIPDEGE